LWEALLLGSCRNREVLGRKQEKKGLNKVCKGKERRAPFRRKGHNGGGGPTGHAQFLGIDKASKFQDDLTREKETNRLLWGVAKRPSYEKKKREALGRDNFQRGRGRQVEGIRKGTGTIGDH